MSKTSEIGMVVEELRIAAQTISTVADNLNELFINNTDKTPEGQSPEPKPVSLEQVRAALAERSRSGHTAEVRELLQKHGADRLSAINPVEYPVLLMEAAALGSTTKEIAHG